MWVEFRTEENKRSFTMLINKVYLTKNEQINYAILNSYFAFTTLSTVGLGDLHPTNNDEYLLMCIVFIVGVLCFSYIKDQFSGTIIEIKNLEPQVEEFDNLHRFINLI